MYHILLALGLCLAYGLFAYGFAWFFGAGPVRLSRRSVVYIALVAVAGDFVSTLIPDWQLANRVLHILAGGFAGYLACVLAARDASLAIGRARFAIVAALLVTALGVANEHLELALQSFAHLRFAATVSDTWLDLASNTVGIALGALALTWLVPTRHSS